jgi:hypothetical protein
MKLFRRITGFFVASAFFVLTSVQAYHSHSTDASASVIECSVCKLTQQPIGMSEDPSIADPLLEVAETRREPLSQPLLTLVFASHGLSPPLV